MKKATVLLLMLACLLGGEGGSAAGTRLVFKKLVAGGLEVRQLVCTLEDGGYLGSVLVVGALVKQKKALDECAPEGAAVVAEFTWKGRKVTDVLITRTSRTTARKCFLRALQQVEPEVDGSCSLIILAGNHERAELAAADIH